MEVYQEMLKSDHSILEVEIDRARKHFKHPLMTGKPITMTQSTQTSIPPNCNKTKGLSRSKIKL